MTTTWASEDSTTATTRVSPWGQAAELLDGQPAFLRSLDAADVLHPVRSAGGHRRYSRHQLEYAGRIRSLFDQGITLEAASRILRLEDELAMARRRLSELETGQPDSQH
jgi:MerR family transcriptional regulator/heat shock protein HspR